MQELIQEYKKSLKQIEKAKATASEEDKKLLSGMESDLRYTLEWLQTGRRPGNKRGIERRAAYQREQPLDPLWMQAYVANTSTSHCGISEHDKEIIEEALSALSEKEREVYMMVRGECFSRNDVAYMLCVKKGTINKILSRCDQKMKIKKR